MKITRQTTYQNLPEWVAPVDVSGYLGLGRSTVYELIRSGELPSRRFGRRLFVLKEALRPSMG